MEKYPQNLAVTSSQGNLTYEELYKLSQQLGHQLQQLGAASNQLVAVVMEKGWEQIVAVMGILAAGAAYVPIAPDLPKERRLHLLHQGEVKLVLTQSKFNTNLEWSENVICICVDTLEIPDSITPLELLQKPSDLAYVIYTSGSTGLPKGVTISHQGAVNTIIDINQRFRVSSQDRVFALSSLSFDLSVYDIFGTLAVGATIVIPDASATKDPVQWISSLAKQQVSIWNSVPALMQMLVEYVGTNQLVLPSSLRLVLLSGDWLPLNLPEKIRALCPQEVEVISLGGATEASIWSILYPIEQVDPHWKSIPYGRPMVNQNFYVLNEALQPCPVWVPGQLYIGGIGLALSYWRNEEKTRSSFFLHPQTKERLYKTGDLGRYLPDGNIEFLGREDSQVKVNGYRIELGEIETSLLQHPDIRSAVIVAVGHENNKERLVAYVVTEDKIIINTEEMRQFLREKLPEYMLPSAFITIDALPLSANGKVNRSALPNADKALRELNVNYVAPKTEIEQIISGIIQDVLGVDKVGIHHNFFELGANSLSMTKIFNQLNKSAPNDVKYISLVDLFKYPTIHSLTTYLSQSQITPDLLNKMLDREEHIRAGKNRLQKRLQKSKITN